MPNGVVAVGDVAKSSQSAAVKLARRKAAITELSDKHYFKDGIRPSSKNISRRLSLQPRSMSADIARQLQEAGKYRAIGNRERARHRLHVAREVRLGNLGPYGKHASLGVRKSNIREYPYLPEWVKDSFAATTTRNVLNPTDLYASSRLMVRSQAQAEGRSVRGRRLKRMTQAERRFAEGRMMLYSPLGRGSVMYG